MMFLAFMTRTDRPMFLAPILRTGLQALRVVCLMGGVFILAALPAYSQAVLEDWASLRASEGGTVAANALWQAEAGKDQCFNQTFSVANNKGTSQIAGCGTNCVQTTNWSCLYTGFQPNGPVPLYSYPNGYLQHYIKSGTWDPLYNRMKFTLTCTTDWAVDSGQSGNYVKGHSDPDTRSQGQHYYWRLYLDAHANRPMTMWLNSTVQHQVGGSTMNWPNDVEWVYPSSPYPVHFFDGLTRFYIFPWYFDQATTDRTCSIGPITLYRQLGEPDEYVATYSGQYNGSGYEFTWQGPKNNKTTYEVRYSTTQSLRTAGFSSGTVAGTTTSTGNAYPDVTFTTANMPEASTIWFGIRPKPSVIGATNTSPIIITTMQDMMLSSGDSVVVSGVQGNSAANGTWTVTTVSRTFCLSSTGCVVSAVADHTKLPNNITITTAAPHGLTPGMVVQTVGGTLYPAEWQIATVPTSTSFTIGWSGVADGTYTTDFWNMPALILQGSTGNGTFRGDTITGSGNVVAAAQTKYFTEIALSKSGSAPNACDLNSDGVVDTGDVDLAVKAAIGTAPCVADLNGDGRCDVVDAQRVINASLPGGTCKVGQ
jgi:hypothetical protein